MDLSGNYYTTTMISRNEDGEATFFPCSDNIIQNALSSKYWPLILVMLVQVVTLGLTIFFCGVCRCCSGSKTHDHGDTDSLMQSLQQRQDSGKGERRLDQTTSEAMLKAGMALLESGDRDNMTVIKDHTYDAEGPDEQDE